VTTVTNEIPYHFEIAVSPEEIDFMGHVNNAFYLTWVQEAVLAHWRSIASPDEVNAHLWVALQHEIKYLRPTFLGDIVCLTVRLKNFQGARAFYEILIKRSQDILAEVKSSWCCIDAQTLRPTRLAREVVERFTQRPHGRHKTSAAKISDGQTGLTKTISTKLRNEDGSELGQ
jgi:acyl-CoA thioester hydrolase